MKLLIFASRRLGRLLLTIFLISTIVFFVIRIIPGDPALVVAGMDATQEAIASIRAKLGTDQPLPVQYLQWLWKVVRFDFGESLISGQPVIKLVFQRFPLTLSLAVLGILISIVIAIPLGVLSAVKRWSFWDYSGMAFSQIGMAIPSFWLGIMLLLIFAVKIQIFPLFGSGSIVHLILPAISLGIARAAIILRLTRASMIEELSKEYVITARAKGLTETRSEKRPSSRHYDHRDPAGLYARRSDHHRAGLFSSRAGALVSDRDLPTGFPTDSRGGCFCGHHLLPDQFHG